MKDRTCVMEVALGQRKADMAVINGKIVNVYTREIYDGGVAVCEDTIAAVGQIDHCIGPNTTIIDANGNYLLPGFIDGHIHPESTSLSIRQFAEVVLAHGTTCIMADMHEVGAVGGLDAMEAVLSEAADIPLKTYFVVPSHIPFAPDLETSGGSLDSSVVAKALKRPDAIGLSEIVAPYLLQQFPDLLESMELTRASGKSLQGHMPETTGPALQACLAAGVATDHESLTADDVLERIRHGCYAMIREGSVAHNLPACIKAVTEHNVDTTMCSIITDDLHTIDLVDKGHLDESVRVALANGVDFPTAVQMVTVNAARAFNLDQEIGSLTPGRRADICITTGPENFRVKTVIAGGTLVAEDEKPLQPLSKVKHDSILLNTVKLDSSLTGEALVIKVDPKYKEAKVKVMRTFDWIPLTEGEEATLPVVDGIIKADPAQDVIHIAQVERHGKGGRIGKAFMAGFNLQSGALASTVGHDNHNITILGVNPEDMAFAGNRLAEIGGGQIVVNNGQIVHEVPLPILGLLSDVDAWTLAKEKRRLIEAAHQLGCDIIWPFMFLSFITLAAAPKYAVTDRGFIDVMQQKIIDPVLELK